MGPHDLNAERRMLNAEFTVRHSAFSIQHSAFSVQRSAFSIQHSLCSAFEERPQLPAARRVPELAQRLGLDLADPFAGDGEALADFLERVLAAVADAEP